MTNSPDRATVGKMGEDIATSWLESHGYKIIERNYWKKFGEIDIIASRARVLHFVEVKTVTRSLSRTSRQAASGGLAANPDTDSYDALDNIHPWKLKRLGRAIQIYLLERNVDDDQDWQVDAISVELDYETRRARVHLLPDIGV